MRIYLFQYETKLVKIRASGKKPILYKKCYICRRDNKPKSKPTNYTELFSVHITYLKIPANCLPVPFLFLHTMNPRDNVWTLLKTEPFVSLLSHSFKYGGSPTELYLQCKRGRWDFVTVFLLHHVKTCLGKT